MSEMDKLIDLMNQDEGTDGPCTLKWWWSKGKAHLHVDTGDISMTCARGTLEDAAWAAADLYREELKGIEYERRGGHPSLTAGERGAGI